MLCRRCPIPRIWGFHPGKVKEGSGGDVPQHRLQGGTRCPQHRRCRGRRHRPWLSPRQISRSNSHHANRQIPQRGARRRSTQPMEWAASISCPSSDLAMGKNGYPPCLTTSFAPQLPMPWPGRRLVPQEGHRPHRRGVVASKPEPSSLAGEKWADPRNPLHQRLLGELEAPSGGEEGDGEEGKGRRRLGFEGARIAPAGVTWVM